MACGGQEDGYPSHDVESLGAIANDIKGGACRVDRELEMNSHHCSMALDWLACISMFRKELNKADSFARCNISLLFIIESLKQERLLYY